MLLLYIMPCKCLLLFYMNVIQILFLGEAVHCSQAETRIIKWSPIISQLMGTTVIIPCDVVNSGSYGKYWKDNFGNIVDTDNNPRHKVNNCHLNYFTVQ